MSVVNHLRELTEAFGDLVEQHVRLLRLELAEDARFYGMRVGVIAALAPLVLIGYGLVCIAIALALRHLMPVELAFALVGAVNLGGGIYGILRMLKQLEQRKPMNNTLEQLQTSTTLFRRDGQAASLTDGREERA